MKPDDTQTIALEVRTITSKVENLQASRDRHDKKATERFEEIYGKLNAVNEYIAESKEFKRQLLDDNKEMKLAIQDLTAMSNQAKGGWWAIAALSTIFSIVGSGLTLLGSKMFK